MVECFSDKSGTIQYYIFIEVYLFMANLIVLVMISFRLVLSPDKKSNLLDNIKRVEKVKGQMENVTIVDLFNKDEIDVLKLEYKIINWKEHEPAQKNLNRFLE